jgi:hypothetical protein
MHDKATGNNRIEAGKAAGDPILSRERAETQRVAAFLPGRNADQRTNCRLVGSPLKGDFHAPSPIGLRHRGARSLVRVQSFGKRIRDPAGNRLGGNEVRANRPFSRIGRSRAFVHSKCHDHYVRPFRAGEPKRVPKTQKQVCKVA